MKSTADLLSKLILSEERYRRLFETARDGILLLNASTGLIIDANPFISKLTGYSEKELLNKHIWDLGFLKNIAANKSKFLELQEKGYARYENLPIETKAGEIHSVEFISNSYLVGDDRVIQCNIRDISSRIEVEKFLHIRLRYNARFPLNFLDQLHHKPLDKLILIGGLQGLINSEMTQHGRSVG